MNQIEVIAVLVKTQTAIGEALTREQQLFVSAQYPKLETYLHTDAGKQALQTFVYEWHLAVNPPAVKTSPAPADVPDVRPGKLPFGATFKINQ